MELIHELRELRRQNAVVLYGVSSSSRVEGGDPELDAIARTAADVLGVGYAGVHVLDDGEQITLGSSDAHTHRPVPESTSICAVVLEHDTADVVEIPDATEEDRLQDNPFVNGEWGHVRFYAAAPLVTAAGEAIGTLCVVDAAPRTLDDSERRILLYLGYAVVHVLERRRRRTAAARQR